jgi:tetratricopeptide (TPR) repeat protein
LANINTKDYWNGRYLAGGNSGAGSYGRLAAFKAEIINDFVEAHGIKSMGEIGCGDGNQLGLFRIEKYSGFDISQKAIQICSEKYKFDPSKTFEIYNPLDWSSRKTLTAELVISLDVIYHLLEDDTYNQYLSNLFNLSSRFVIIYANNTDIQGNTASHLRYHKFTDWVKYNCQDWNLSGFVPNRYPYREESQSETSFADFYFFSKNEKLKPKFSIYFPDKSGVPSTENDNQVSVEELMGLARQNFQNGSPQEALVYLKQIVDINPEHKLAMNNMALILASLGRFQEAEELFKAVLAQDTSFSLTRLNITKMYLQQNRWIDLNYFYNEVFLLSKQDDRIKNVWPTLYMNIENLSYLGYNN